MKFYLDFHRVTRPWRRTLTKRKWRQIRISGVDEDRAARRLSLRSLSSRRSLHLDENREESAERESVRRRVRSYAGLPQGGVDGVRRPRHSLQIATLQSTSFPGSFISRPWDERAWERGYFAILYVTLSLPGFKKYIFLTFLRRNVVWIGSIITFHLSKLWKAKFFILCDVLFLVRLQEKFEIDHSTLESEYITRFRVI